MRKLLLFLLGAILITSCSVNQNFDFNDDFSGNYSLEVDMSGMAALMGDEDSEPLDVLAEMNVDSIVDAMNTYEGISNTQLIETESIIKMSYDFTSLEVLNQSLQGQDLDMMSGSSPSRDDKHIFFTQKGKNLIYHSPEFDREEIMADPEASTMFEMMSYTLNISYPGGFKKVKNDRATLSNGQKTVSLECSMSDAINEENLLDIPMKIR